MQNNMQLEETASCIADAIVALVGRTDGPVTLSQIAREVPGFAKREGPAWSRVIDYAGGEATIWEGMTEAGMTALGKVMLGRRVAVQMVDAIVYMLDGITLGTENWVPIVLLPVRAANLETPNWLMRASPKFREHAVARAAAERKGGYRLLTPRPLRYMADQFSL